MPLVKAVEWNEAASPLKGLAESRLGLDALGLGVDVGKADLVGGVLLGIDNMEPAVD